MENYGIIIIGTGAGEGTLAYTLAETRKKSSSSNEEITFVEKKRRMFQK